MTAAHRYNVRKIVEQAAHGAARILYRAACSCGEPFDTHPAEMAAAYDGLAHVRASRGLTVDEPASAGEVDEQGSLL